MTYFIDQMEGLLFSFSFVANYLVLGPLMSISSTLVFKTVKPESAGFIMNFNATIIFFIMSVVLYLNGKIQDSCGPKID